MKKLILSAALLVSSMSAVAITPLWMRDVRISPDGKNIVFCYKGDIYKVAAEGGEAVQLTTQDSYESAPVWSPDSKQIAFASNRFGGNDLFIMSANGGSARRLTTNSAQEVPTAFTPCGKYVVFTASIQDPHTSAMFPTGAMTELYKVPVKGGKTVQMLGTPAEMVCFNTKGTAMLYQDNKGFEDEWRKHHTSSITRDVWMYDTATGKHTNLSNRAGEDRNPVFSADEKEVYFLSERNKGSFNVYKAPVNDFGAAKAVTSFKTHPVRFLSIAQNGTLCYTYDGAIYTQKQNGRAQKVNIEVTRDDEAIPASLAFASGISEAVASPDGKQIAFVVRGEVFVTSVEYGTTKQITHTPEAEKGISFGADNRTLVYASERGGNWGLYTAKIAREEDLNFPNATLIEEEALLPSKTIERTSPQFSPDGKEVAFVEGRRRLMVVDLKSKKVRQITDGSTYYRTDGGFEYSWSPDGKWFTLEHVANMHDPYNDIAIVKADGKSQIVNLTNSGYMSGSPKWVMNGNAIIFNTERYGMRNHASWGSMEDVMMVFMNQDAFDKFRLNEEDYELEQELKKEQEKAAKEAEKKDDKKKDDKKKDEKKDDKKDIVIETDGIQDRILRLTPNSSNLASAVVTNDGKSLYYLSAFEDGYDLWKMDLREGDTKLVRKLNSGWCGMDLDKSGKNVFIMGSSSLKKLTVGSDAIKPISFMAKMKMDLAAEREYMFNHIYKQEKLRFYDEKMHGVDWEGLTRAYRKFLPHINNNYDFSTMLSEWLGELNVSHTGSGYRPMRRAEATAELGLLYDLSYEGKGLKVAEILEKCPFDRKTTKVEAGVIVEKINGEEIGENTDVAEMLNGKAGVKTLISFYNPATKARWDEVVKPVSRGVIGKAMYDRWVKQRAADVEKWSNGRLGYVHIESMNDESFRTVYSDILGKYNKCDGIVIDTRFNGGGRLHEDIEILFSGEKYLTQVVRGREACDMRSRRWNKPSIMVQCEANYSNAHGTPWVYKHKKMGKLVGAPVPGTMTSVNWETLQDPSLYFGIPVIGYRTAEGTYLENDQLEPDVYVLNAPETIVKGEDTQLKAAVEELLKQIDKK